jgi:shikimate dehydrogenase
MRVNHADDCDERRRNLMAGEVTMPQRMSFKQELVGVFGCPVAENPTQPMVEAAFRDMELDWRYLTVEVRPDDLRDAVLGARAMNWRGFNCTIPHKVAVIRHLDRLSPAAELIGAVNCVINRDGELLGDNTDGKGFLQSLANVHGIRGLHAVVLGAGGAARAIAVELALAGASRLTIVNRSAERGETLSKLICEHTLAAADSVKWEAMYPVPADAELLVNATSIGLFPDLAACPPIDFDRLRRGMIVADVIPNPPRTNLLREASARGCTVLDGLGMLVNQAVIGIRLWSEREPDPKLMREALEDVLG